MKRENHTTTPGLTVLTAALLTAILAFTPAPNLVRAYQQALKVSANFADKLMAPTETLELQLSRSLQSAEGKLAIIIGQTDFTNLFTSNENSLRFTPHPQPLPTGENEV